MTKNEFKKVAETDDLNPGEGLGIELNGIEIALFNVGGEFYAISNRCSHQRAPLCKVGEKKINGELCWTETRGNIDKDSITVSCPWHLWEWDLECGVHEVSEQQIGTFDVKVENDDVLVRI